MSLNSAQLIRGALHPPLTRIGSDRGEPMRIWRRSDGRRTWIETADVEPGASFEIQLQDYTGLLSIPRVVQLQGTPLIPHGGVCDPAGMANICAPGNACTVVGTQSLCQNPQDILNATCAASPSLTNATPFSGNTTGAPDVIASSCSFEPNGGDVFVRYTVGAAAVSVNVRLTSATDQGFTVAQNCMTELVCQDLNAGGTDETALVPNVAPGTVLNIAVHPYTVADAGAFTITVTEVSLAGVGQACNLTNGPQCQANLFCTGPAGASFCRAQVCGDGLIVGTEQCDDSNMGNGDGCSSTCQDECAGPEGTTSITMPQVISPPPGCSGRWRVFPASISAGGDMDWYQVTLAAGATLTVDTHNTVPGQCSGILDTVGGHPQRAADGGAHLFGVRGPGSCPAGAALTTTRPTEDAPTWCSLPPPPARTWSASLTTTTTRPSASRRPLPRRPAGVRQRHP